MCIRDSTPTVDDKHVYAIGGSGLVTCWHTGTKKVVWSIHLVRDLGGRKPGDGYSESPLVVGKALIVTPGARGGGIVVALDRKTGKVIWKDSGVHDNASQCSAILATIGGKKVIVQGLRRGTVGIDAETGRFLWTFKPPTAHAATPIVHDGMVFNSTGYGKGSGVGRIGPGGVETVWHDRKLGNHHGGVVRVGDHLYGMLGARRGRDLYCVAFRTGRIAWKNPATGKGSLVYADGHLYCFGENQRVTLVEATPEAYHQKGQFRLPRDGTGQAWAHPVVANGCLFIRHGNALYCYDVKAK